MATAAVSSALDKVSQALSGKTGSNKTSSEALQERFLTMLVSQLQNQDPLNPMDNAQVTSQLAQINTVNGVNSTNETLKTLLESFNGMQTLQGANMIGRTVWAQNDSLNYTSGKTAAGKVELAGPADKVKINILDADGKTVRTIDMGPLNTGVKDFAWDGKDDKGNALPTGAYTIKIDASYQGKTVDAISQTQGVVKSVSQDGSGLALSVDGFKNAIRLSQIRQVL